MTDSSENFGRRWFEEIWNRKRREAIGEMIAPDAVIHDGAAVTFGPGAFYLFFDRMVAAFPDIRVNVEDTFAEGDKMCIRWSSTGKHTGEGLGVPPAGRTVNISGISIVRLKGTMMVEAWQNWDMLGMMEQIKGIGGSATYIVASEKMQTVS